MTSKDIHDDDAEFDDFLLGKGELSNLLQALPQPGASAKLDERILRDIEARLATPAVPAPAPAAANDAASHPEQRPAPGFFARWRTPLGLAATLVLTMSITMTVWRGQNIAETPAILSENQSLPAPATSAAAESAAAPAAETATVSAAAPAAPSGKNAQASSKESMASVQDAASDTPTPLHAHKAKKAARHEPQEERKISEPEKADQHSASVAQDAGTQRLREAAAGLQKKKAEAIPPHAPMPAPPPPPLTAPVAAPMPAPMPAMSAPMPAPVPAPQAQAQPEGQVRVQGHKVRRLSDDKAAADAASAGEPAESASEWLQRLEKLLQEGKHKQALEEWRKFRLAWPNYPVAPATEKQIEALQAQK